MNSFKSLLSFVFLLGLVTVLVSCDDDEAEPQPVVATTVTDIAADPATGVDPQTGQPIGTTGKFALFSFKDGAVVANADSATTKWDVGFRGTTIIINGGTSGPGSAGAQIELDLFENVVEAAADGYATDDKNSTSSKYAIPTGSGNGWYNYDGATNLITPIAGRVLVFKTADGAHYAKMEILSYYKGNPATPSSSDVARYYSFRYAYQPNDSRSFE